MNPSAGPQSTDDVLRARRAPYAELGRVCVISPHLDDAVLSCGALLAGCPQARVVTLMAGVPPDGPPPAWDSACGFACRAQAMRARRVEDAAALACLDAVPCHLDFLDAQYEVPPELTALQAAIGDEAAKADTVLVPLGLFHADHELTHRAALCAWRRSGAGQRWWAYEDALYRRKPGLLQQRLAHLYSEGVRATPLPALPAQGRAKALAVQAYASQLAGLGLAGQAGDAAAPEGYWRLESVDAP